MAPALDMPVACSEPVAEKIVSSIPSARDVGNLVYRFRRQWHWKSTVCHFQHPWCRKFRDGDPMLTGNDWLPAPQESAYSPAAAAWRGADEAKQTAAPRHQRPATRPTTAPSQHEHFERIAHHDPSASQGEHVESNAHHDRAGQRNLPRSIEGSSASDRGRLCGCSDGCGRGQEPAVHAIGIRQQCCHDGGADSNGTESDSAGIGGGVGAGSP